MNIAPLRAARTSGIKYCLLFPGTSKSILFTIAMTHGLNNELFGNHSFSFHTFFTFHMVLKKQQQTNKQQKHKNKQTKNPNQPKQLLSSHANGS